MPSPIKYPEYYSTDFDASGDYWGSNGTFSVSGGEFHSSGWWADDNHRTAYGGVGRLHLLAYRQTGGWEYTSGGVIIGSDFTRARVKVRVRGVGFTPGPSTWLLWIQARHPTVPGKLVNWARTGKPLTAKLTSGNWEDVEEVLEPDPAMWTWGKGVDGYYYDTFLSIEESLQNIANFHLPTVGPDGCSPPGGTFEMDSFSIVFNRNAPTPIEPPPSPPPPPPPPPPEPGTEVLVDRTLGTHFSNSNVSAFPTSKSFDGVSNTTGTNCTARSGGALYVGTTWGAGKRFSRALVYGRNESDGFGSLGSVTIRVYGKNGTPANDTDGALLGTITFTGQANESVGREIVSTDVATAYTSLWVRIDTGTTAYCAEVMFYERA